MASGRIIHKTIHTNEQLADLDINCRYLYMSTIVHSDDEGRMKASPKFLKALIFPFDEAIRIGSIKDWRDKLSASGLIQLYAAGGQEYLVHPNWEKWQPIRSDRVKPSDCPPPLDGIPVDNQMTTNGCPNLTKPNLTKPNLTKQFGDFQFLENKAFSDVFNDYLEMRKKIRKPATDKAKEIALKMLHDHPIDVAIKMLQQSIMNSWQGIFPLKETAKVSTTDSMERIKRAREQADKILADYRQGNSRTRNAEAIQPTGQAAS